MTQPDTGPEGEQRRMGGWGKPRLVLDPLALLLRERYASRAELARVSGLGYQTLRTYTDGLWTRDKPPTARVLGALARAVDPAELDTAVRAALAGRPEKPLTFGQQVVLEALAGFKHDRLTAVAPFIHELLRDFPKVPTSSDDQLDAGVRDGLG